ncbi:MAG TPA: hypothetical protein VHK04_12730, partial [Castellaniella sp.]|nr:hypothetical protein [Castellaniella sp.]
MNRSAFAPRDGVDAPAGSGLPDQGLADSGSLEFHVWGRFGPVADGRFRRFSIACIRPASQHA